MKKAIVVMGLALLAGGAMPAAVAQDSAAVERQDAREALFQTDQAWAAAASAGQDAAYVASFWSEEGVIVPDGEPIVSGKAAILDFVTQAFATPGFRIQWTPRLEDVHVSADGTMGYSVSESSTTFPAPDGSLATVQGRGVSIWTRQPDGSWKCVYDIWNDAPSK